jgi:predicted nucleotidyltransferase
MISSEQIQQAVERLIVAAKPSKVILFGSYARGDATDDSDLDLMVIEQEVSNKFDEMVRLRNVMGDMGVGVDLLVYSDSEASRRSQVPGTVLHTAFNEGRVIYDARH